MLKLIIKYCYDTHENIKARMKFQTDKGQKLLVENAETENEALFTQAVIENIVLQVGTKELQTLGEDTSGYMLLDFGCSKSVAGQA